MLALLLIPSKHQLTCKILSTNAELERERAAPITTASSTREMLTNSAGEWKITWSPAKTAFKETGGRRMSFSLDNFVEARRIQAIDSLGLCACDSFQGEDGAEAGFQPAGATFVLVSSSNTTPPGSIEYQVHPDLYQGEGFQAAHMSDYHPA